jgi:DNA-binding response OmpR family regulator
MTVPVETYYTPTEHRILLMLNDGQRHRTKELKFAVGDEHTSLDAVRMAISTLRKKLEPQGQNILCEFYKGGYYYRHVRLITQ